MSLDEIRRLANEIIVNVDKLSTPAKKGTVIPFYIYPTNPVWQSLANMKQQFKDTDVIAVINPASGPGNAKNQDYVNGINMLRNAGVRVFGYVASGYGNKPAASVKAEIDKYKSWYSLDGIFFDEVKAAPEFAAYYKSLTTWYSEYQYIGNAGTGVTLNWFDIFDIIVVYENVGLPAPSQYDAYTGKKASIIPYGVTTTMTETLIRQFFMRLEYLYFTGDSGSNPWDTLDIPRTQQVLAIADDINSGGSTSEIIVTPENYMQKLKNTGNVDFSGSTSEYVQVTADQVRLELPTDYENVRISGMIQVTKIGTGQNYVIQEYGRGGHHSDNDKCAGCAYKGRFLRTNSTIVKEVEHPCYTGNRNSIAKTYVDILSRWVEMATEIINNPDNSVTIKTFLDGVQVGETKDTGGWATTSTAWKADCPRRQFNTTGFRQRDEILNKAGVLVAWRSDGGTIWRFRWLKVTKI